MDAQQTTRLYLTLTSLHTWSERLAEEQLQLHLHLKLYFERALASVQSSIQETGVIVYVSVNAFVNINLHVYFLSRYCSYRDQCHGE